MKSMKSMARARWDWLGYSFNSTGGLLCSVNSNCTGPPYGVAAATVRARPGRLSSLSVSHRYSVL
jgi:hypothetical protein